MLSSALVVISILSLITLFVYSLMRSWWVLFFGSCLLLFGIWALFSVSIHESFTTTLKMVNEGTLASTSNYFYFFGQVEKLLLWLVAWLITYFVPWTVIKKFKLPIFIVSILMMWLLFTPLATDLDKWAKLRIDAWFINLQPGEFFKLWLTFFLVSWLVRKKRVFDELRYYLWFMFIMWLSALLFFVLPDFGSLLVIGPVSLILFLYFGGKRYYVAITLLLALFAWFIASAQFDYVKDRMEFFLNPEADQDFKGIWRQTRQALVAVWWGWWIGKWYGKWLQKFGYIPEAQSDFIFSAFAEEIGFIGNLFLLVFYFLLARHSIKGLRGVHDEYDKGMLVALISLIIVQMFVNIWVNIKIVPLTGITLPFISHGWSALIINMIEVILIHKIIYRR